MNEKQTQIGGRTISVGWLSPVEAVKVEVALINLCGAALFEALSKKGVNPEEAGSAAISALSNNVDSNILIEAMERIYAVVTIDGKRMPMEEAFGGGRHKELWQVMFFALRYNFKDFLPASLFKQVADKAKAMSSQLNSPTSTGTSTDQ